MATTGTFRYQFDCSNNVTSTDISNNLPILNTNNSITVTDISATIISAPIATLNGATFFLGTRTITVASTAGLSQGNRVVGTGIPDGTTITSIISATEFNISVSATASGPTTITVYASIVTYNIGISYSYNSVSGTDGLTFNVSQTVLDYYNNTNGTSGISNLEITDLGGIPISTGGSQFAGLTTLTSFNSGITAPYIGSNASFYAMFYTCTNLTQVTFDNSFDTTNVTNMRAMFSSCYSLTSLTFGTNFNASNVTTMRYMFSGCISLTSLDVTNFDTANVTNMVGMFNLCYSLTSLDVTNFDTANVRDMYGMFAGCFVLTSLDLSNFNTSKVTNMSYMFEMTDGQGNTQDSSLNIITFGQNFDPSACTNMTNMFYNCNNLINVQHKDISNNTVEGIDNWNTSNVTNMTSMFENNERLLTIGDVYANWNVTNVGSNHANFSLNSLLTNIPNFTDSRIDASGTLFFQQSEQSGSDVQYSSSVNGPWTDVSSSMWPITLTNTDSPSSTLNVTFATDLSFNALTQYFILDSSNIIIDGSNNVVNINVDLYPGLVKNGTADTSGNSNITIRNLGVESSLTNYGGWIGQIYFGINATDNLVTNCYSTGDIGGGSGGIIGGGSSGFISNCYSTGSIGGQAGGIFGSYSSGSASNCYSTGTTIYSQAGGIFGSYSSGSASNCYSRGTIYRNAGGIFGFGSQGSATNCYSIGPIGTSAGGIFGSGSQAGASAINCYSIGTISGTNAGGIFGSGSQAGASATNCYSTGTGATNINKGIGTNIDISYCYYTDGSTNWLDASANALLNVTEPNAWTDIDLSANNVPYLLSSFTSTLYNPSSATDASNSTASVLTDCSFSIVSVNGLNPSLYTGITIDSNTGDISFNSLPYGVIYEVNVLATNTKDGYSFGTFTNSLPTIIDASGTVELRQNGSVLQYSNDDGVTWTDAVWPVTLINDGTGTSGARALAALPLIMTFTTDLSLNSADQYFIIDSSNIIIDGSNHVVYVNVSTNDYPGLFQNGTVDTSGNSNITIRNIGVESTYSVAELGGWIGQAYFGQNATENYVENCYSTGTISDYAGGIFGYSSEGTVTNCYSTGTISGISAGGIFGQYSTGSATNCYSTNHITGNNAGGIFGDNSQGTATNCYSTGDIGEDGGGIFGRYSEGSATNCYSIGAIAIRGGGIFGPRSIQCSATNCYSTGNINGGNAGGIFGFNTQICLATNCYSTGTIIGNSAGGIFGSNIVSSSATNCYSIGSITSGTGEGIGSGIDVSYCYYTDGSTNWLDSAADASLNMDGSWTDIDENSTNVPYRLTSFLISEILYDPSGGENVNPKTPVEDISGNYTWSITSVNGSTTDTSGITIDVSNGNISFGVSSNGTYAVNVLAEDSFGNYSFETFTNIISNICFPAGTPIVTNQGIIAINKINPAIHTIRNKKIVAITKTVTPDKYLVRFEKDALGTNLPCEATTMTKNHMLFYKGKMMKADEFLKTHNELVSKVPYNGQTLYNVLMEEHDKMVVNNLICETLHPDNYVAQMYHAFKTLTPKQRIEAIQKVNKVVLTEGIYKKPTSKR